MFKIFSFLIGTTFFLNTVLASSVNHQQLLVSQAKQDFETFRIDNPELTENTFSAIEELKANIKKDSKLRMLFKAARKNKAARAEADDYIHQHFAERKVRFGYLSADAFISLNLILGGITIRGKGGDYFNYQVEAGPGLGAASGYGIIACLLEGSGFNIGVGARAVVIGGVSVGTYIGMNGVCAVVGVGYGLNASAGLGMLRIL